MDDSSTLYTECACCVSNISWMKENMDKHQRKLLDLIIDQYEGTATYRGDSQKHQNIRVPVTKVFRDYDRDDADLTDLRAFEASMRRFAADTPVRILYRDPKTRQEFSGFSVPAEDVEPGLYSLAGRVPRRELHLGQIPSYEAFRGKDGVLDRFVDAQEALLRSDKNAWFSEEDARDVMRALVFILKNENDILFREVSIAVFGDTKYMERRGLFGKTARVLGIFGGQDFAEADFESKKEYAAALLAEHMVYENPTYVNFNGNGRISFENGTGIALRRGTPVAIRSDQIGRIREMKIDDRQVMTIENLTSYNRLQSDSFQIYLAGYHNRAKQEFLRKIYAENPGVGKWLHFGDIDPDGFCILENLRKKTGIDFKPYGMGTEMLEAYAAYTKPLTAGDRVKAENLMKDGKYTDVMKYMLAHDTKLEQEIISWRES